jgi:predicted lipid-binding transport protein (Tim44 family)
MDLVDAIVVLLVLAFAVSRFVGYKLPRDSTPKQPIDRGNPKRVDWANVRQQFGRRVERKPAEAATPKPSLARPAVKRVDLKGLSGLEQIKALEPEFDEAKFKAGTVAAYKYFYKCWNAMDVDKLAQVVAPELLAQLADTLEGYRARAAKPLVSVGKVDVAIGKAKVMGRTAVIEAEIAAAQTDDEVKNARNATAAQPHPVRVTWVLARPFGSDDPNWELQRIIPRGGKA